MRAETVIKSIFPSVVHAKKLNKYREAEWKDASESDLSIPDDATIYFKESNHFFGVSVLILLNTKMAW